MLGRRAGRIGMVLMLGVATTGVAVAATTGSTAAVSGSFDVTVTGPPGFKQCGDAPIAVIKSALTGTATSSDPRLAGAVTMRLRIVAGEEGPSTTLASVFIHDADTGRLNANGTFDAVRTDEGLSGVMDLQLHRPAGHAVAVVGLRLEPGDTPSGFHLVGEYGEGKTAPALGVVTTGC